MQKNKTIKDTRERIEDAGATEFAENGFRAATVRHICRRAGVGIASINYYYGDKEGLYHAILEKFLKESMLLHPPLTGVNPGAPPEVRLHALIRGHLYRILGRSGWFGSHARGRMLAREMAHPSEFTLVLVERYIRPLKDAMFGVVAELLNPRTDPETVRLCAVSIVGQCLHNGYGRPFLKHLGAAPDTSGEGIEKLAEGLTQFALGGIAFMKKRKFEKE